MSWTNNIIVFTKPWKTDSLPQLADRVADLGFTGIELPVREGFQVTPANYRETLPEAKAAFAKRNLAITSIAGAIDLELIKVMGNLQIPLLRVMLNADPQKNYLEQEETHYRAVSEMLSTLEASGVTLGVQNHYGNFIGCSAAGLMRFVGRFPKEQVAAVLDLAHCAICGEIPEFALDIAASHLAMVNLKCGSLRRTNPETSIEAEWKTVWTTAAHGALSWKRAAHELRCRSYAGNICLTAEYSGADKPLEGEESARLVRQDFAYWNSL
jgi:sugar phosphate isomerase/epimerase